MPIHMIIHIIVFSVMSGLLAILVINLFVVIRKMIKDITKLREELRYIKNILEDHGIYKPTEE